MTRPELRLRAMAGYAAQSRAVTAQDYETLIYNMPSKFGGISRVSIVNDPSSSNRRLSMYVISTDTNGFLAETTMVAKHNIKN